MQLAAKWHYDFESGVCREFMYGGCGGNDNLFDSQEDCRQFCGAISPTDKATPGEWLADGRYRHSVVANL